MSNYPGDIRQHDTNPQSPEYQGPETEQEESAIEAATQDHWDSIAEDIHFSNQ